MARPGFEPTTSRSRSGCSTTEPAGPVSASKFSRICDDYICDSDYSVFSIEALPVSQAKLSELREETRKDMELTILKDTILNGWPENKKQLNPRITHFWNFRDEISHFDGLMLKGEK